MSDGLPQGRAGWAPLRALAGLLALTVPIAVLAGGWLVARYGERVLRAEIPARIAVQEETAPSRFLSAEGFVLAEGVRGARSWASLPDLSPWVVRATLASEDQRFFTHGGVDPRGLVRAARENRLRGTVVQGGSTLTQQVAKSFLRPDRSLDRKLDELVVARALEVRFGKVEILEAWLNRTWFGGGATGIEAAAQRMCGRPAQALSAAEASQLVAVVPSPARLDPVKRPDDVRAARDRLLHRMRRLSLLTEVELAEALAAPLCVPGSRGDPAHPDLVFAALRELEAIDAARDWRNGGAEIRLSASLVEQREAGIAGRMAAFRLARRQGKHDRMGHLAPGREAAFDASVAEVCASLVGSDRPEGADRDAPWGVALVRVVAVGPDSVVARCGDRTVSVPREGWDWAVPWRPDAKNHGERLRRADEGWRVGDVAWLLGDGGLAPTPLAQTAFGSVDTADATVRAAVGGVDPLAGEYHRFVQGCRQPGSTFKPIVFGLALDLGWTPASTVRDAPSTIEIGPDEAWTPRNADGRFRGYQSLWEAFIASRNLPAVALYREVGAARTIERAQRLGIRSRLEAVESLVLGASCLSPRELLTTFVPYVQRGRVLEPTLIRAVIGPSGETILRERPVFDPAEGPAERLSALGAGRDRGSVGLSEGTAWRMAWLLVEAARAGTAGALGAAEWRAGGKTGTTTARDAWFAGFTGERLAVSWVGMDGEARELGRGETGGRLALPMWMDALGGVPREGEALGPLPAGLVWAPIDPDTGLLAGAGRGSVAMPFVPGTEPRLTSRSSDRLRIEEIDRSGSEF